jgi:hypothetical protein
MNIKMQGFDVSKCEKVLQSITINNWTPHYINIYLNERETSFDWETQDVDEWYVTLFDDIIAPNLLNKCDGKCPVKIFIKIRDPERNFRFIGKNFFYKPTTKKNGIGLDKVFLVFNINAFGYGNTTFMYNDKVALSSRCCNKDEGEYLKTKMKLSIRIIINKGSKDVINISEFSPTHFMFKDD